ncbi:hypothetical protein [Micromonospora sp. MA102]|uniref:hypothetical protein n=1 Tax=Micromonospora sp. MA102 TaxID=2952755 RepID=UPI0021C9F05A|nr:hypothetical protein [Micromonospora sp. MA102]
MSIKKARAALSHSVFTGVARNLLDRLVAELADPFHAAREGRLYRRRGGRDRRRWPGAGHPETLTLWERFQAEYLPVRPPRWRFVSRSPARSRSIGMPRMSP